MTLTKKSGCKINLLLNILGKRTDGFHELETLMQPVAIYDEMEIANAGATIKLRSDHPTLPCDGSNLIVRAAEKFRSATGISDGVTIHLKKNLPMEAGMGGGSSNAATTLLGLNELFDNPLSATQLSGIAAELGSDVPFFLQSNPALATGRGEQIEPLNPFDCLNGLSLVLVHPGFGISTGWSYKTLANFPQALNGTPGRAKELVRKLRSNGQQWGNELYNSLEAPAFHKYPVLDLYVSGFKNSGAVAALMSGSGSTVFAYFASVKNAEVALDTFKTKFGTSGWSAIVES